MRDSTRWSNWHPERRVHVATPRSVESAAVFRRRRPGPVPDEVAAAFEAFRATLDRVEAAKASLAAAAPGGRSAGAPLAEALAGFEFGLRDARATMDAWRAVQVEESWQG